MKITRKDYSTVEANVDVGKDFEHNSGLISIASQQSKKTQLETIFVSVSCLKLIY